MKSFVVPKTCLRAGATGRFALKHFTRALKRVLGIRRFTRRQREAIRRHYAGILAQHPRITLPQLTKFAMTLAVGILLHTNSAHASGPFITATSPVAAITGLKGTAPAFGDIDGDGDLDLIVGDMDGHDRLRFYRNTGTKTAPVFTLDTLPAGIPATDTGSATSMRLPAMGDIDHDGKTDVAVALGDFYTESTTFHYYKNNGNGTFTEFHPSGLPTSTSSQFGQIRFKDVDFDGDDDAFVISGETGIITYYRNNGNGTFTQTTPPFSNIPSGLSYPLIDFADIDGDGDYDMVVGVWGNGSQVGLKYYRNDNGAFVAVDPATAFPGSNFSLSPGQWLLPCLVDIDGDGDVDLFVGDYQASNGAVPIHYLMNNAPSVVSLTPADNSTNVLLNQTFNINFNSTVAVGTGNVLVKKTSDNSTVATIPVGNLTINGAQASFTVAGLANGTDYYITWAATAFKRSSDNAQITGVNDTSYWSFTTTAAAADTTPPSIVNVTAPANKTYRLGQVLSFGVNFDEATIVDTTSGTPRLPITLDTGGTAYANYASGTGTTNLVFSYTVVNGNLDSNGVTVGGSLDLNGGTLRDAASNNANLALNNVASTASVLIDGVPPTLVSILRETPLNQTVQTTSVVFQVNFSEPVNTPFSGLFRISPVGSSTITGTIASVTGGPQSYDVTVNITGGTGEFRLTLNLP
ncbi:MAG TPA: FG-GAP-like repeat-containing protein [Verrucomicrobiae bacterium]|jgi:methionine-rich copper-binding protein CopC|nr:FG-GAP-like repeat-containing protein [Verrucomicrobiae bacterium]